MARETRSYKDIVIAVETSLSYINNHLQNIDSHLNRQNERLTEHDKSITRNTTRVNLLYKVIGGIIVSGGGTAGILKILGIL